MRIPTTPETVSTYLSAHGGADLLAAGPFNDPAALVHYFETHRPSEEAKPLGHHNLEYLTAVVSCIEVMDSQLYEHYRFMVDLFREGVFRAPREEMLSYPSWNDLRLRGVRLGILPADLYGNDRPVPHIGQVVKGGKA